MRLHDAALEGECLQQIYQVDEKIGKGGMAWVYRGHHVRLGGQVALKILFSALQDETELRERFLREAQVQYALQHPNIVRVLDFIDDREIYGFVCEWCELSDLKSFTEERHGGILPLEQLATLFPPILDALTYAHNQGVVHRDLKPQNILLSESATGLTPKVSDFGIAKLLETDSQTQTGSMLGTLRYAPPEQVQDSKRIDQRADIYSLGVMLYVLLTGRYPFEGTAANLYLQILSEAPPDPEEAPMPLQPLILRCMQKDPEARYPTCDDLQRDLLDALETLDHLTPNLALRRNQLRDQPRATPSIPFQPHTPREISTPKPPQISQRPALPTPTSSSAGLSNPASPESSLPYETTAHNHVADSKPGLPLSIPTPESPPNKATAHPSTPGPSQTLLTPTRVALGSSLLTTVLLLVAFFAWQSLQHKPTTTPAGAANGHSTTPPKQRPTPKKAPNTKQLTPKRPNTKRSDAKKPNTKRPVLQPRPSLAPKSSRRPPHLRRRRIGFIDSPSRRPRKRPAARRPRGLNLHLSYRRRRRKPSPVPRRSNSHVPWWFKDSKKILGSVQVTTTIRKLLAIGRWHGTDGQKHFQRLCDKGYGSGCASLGLRYAAQKKLQLAEDTFRKGCKRSKYKSRYACACLGQIYLGRWPQAIRKLDKKKGCGYMVSICQKGYAWGCKLVNHYRCLPQNVRVPTYDAVSDPQYDHKIDARLNANALMYHANDLRYQNSRKSREYMFLACNLNSGRACYKLVAKLRHEKEHVASFKYAQKSCHLGHISACLRLGYTYLGRYKQTIRFKNQRLACLAFRRGCDLQEREKKYAWICRKLTQFRCPRRLVLPRGF